MGIHTVRQSVIGIFLLGTLPLWPQRLPPATGSDQEARFSVNAEFVLLDVDVKDQNGAHVSHLDKENFQVYENSRPQTIVHFSNQDVPATIGLVIDSSGSMGAKRREVVTAALAFIGASNRSDEMFVVHFNDHVTQGLPGNMPFSSDPNALRIALWKPALGRTALYDAVLVSLHHLERGRQSKKALILISDGGDNASAHGLRDVLALVRASEATIYTIGIFDEADPDRNPGVLRQVAGSSGGEAFFPNELEDVVGICRRIAKDIRNRYTIGYAPSRVDEKHTVRTIRVTAKDGKQKLRVRTRTGYVLPERPRQGRGE